MALTPTTSNPTLMRHLCPSSMVAQVRQDDWALSSHGKRVHVHRQLSARLPMKPARPETPVPGSERCAKIQTSGSSATAPRQPSPDVVAKRRSTSPRQYIVGPALLERRNLAGDAAQSVAARLSKVAHKVRQPVTLYSPTPSPLESRAPEIGKPGSAVVLSEGTLDTDGEASERLRSMLETLGRQFQVLDQKVALLAAGTAARSSKGEERLSSVERMLEEQRGSMERTDTSIASCEERMTRMEAALAERGAKVDELVRDLGLLWWGAELVTRGREVEPRQESVSPDASPGIASPLRQLRQSQQDMTGSGPGMMETIGFLISDSVNEHVVDLREQFKAVLDSAQAASRTDIDVIRKDVRALDASVMNLRERRAQEGQFESGMRDQGTSMESERLDRSVSDLKRDFQVFNDRLVAVESDGLLLTRVLEGHQAQFDSVNAEIAAMQEIGALRTGALVLGRDQDEAPELGAHSISRAVAGLLDA